MAEERGDHPLDVGRLSPLMTALVNKDIDSVEHLARAGADLEDGKVLLSAADDVTVLQALINGGVDINTPNSEGFTVLMVAASTGKKKQTQNLIKITISPDLTDNDGRTALALAAYRGKLSCVKLLADAGADVNLSDILGHTPVMLAAKRGHIKCVKFLSGLVNRIDERDNNGKTALMITSIEGKQECLDVLIKAKADTEGKDHDGKTALMFAVMHGNDKCVHLLVDVNTSPDASDNDEATALILASTEGHLKCCEILILAGADINWADKSGMTPLIHAAKENKAECLQLLVSSKAELDKADQDGSTAVMWCRTESCLNILIHADANLNSADKTGATALIHNARSGNVQCLQTLISAGANLDLSDREGLTALLAAAQYGQEECLTELVNEDFSFYKQADVNGKTAMIKCAEMGYKQCLKILIAAHDKLSGKTSTGKEKSKYTDIQRGLNMCDATGATALMYAIQNKHLDCVKLLKHSGADVNKKDTDGGTALMKAAKVGCHEIIDGLINAGAEINIRDKKGNTALMWSVIEKHPECLTRLTECPDFVADQENIDGMTPVMWAAQNGDTQCLHILLQFQVDVQKKDINGETALFKAAIKGGIAALKVLRKMNESSQVNNRDTILSHAECVSLILEYMESQSYRQRYTHENSPWVQVAAVAGKKYAEFKENFLGEYSKVESAYNSMCRTDENSDYMVMAAVGYSGNVECLNTLLEDAGSGVKNNDDMKSISLVWAVIGRRTETVRFLIQRMQRVTLGLYDPLNYRWELDWYSDFPIECDKERNIYCDTLEIKWQTGATTAIMCDNAEFLKLFIDYKPDIVNYGTCCEKLPLLMFAADRGKVKCFKCLVDNGADVNVTDHNGDPVLKRAMVARDEYARVDDFDNEEKINGNNGLSAIHDKWFKCIETLIERGADVNKVDSVGNSVLMNAVEYKQYDCVQLFTDKGANINYEMNSALTLAMKNVWLSGFKFLLQRQLNEDIVSHKRDTAEYPHSQSKIHSRKHETDELNIVQFFIDKVVNTNYCLDTKGNTALILATQWYGQGSLKLLVEANADINQQNNNGDTALMLARDLETVQYIVSVGADVNLQNNNGDTALMLARDLETVQYLVSVGADVNQQNNNGDTALLLARDLETVQYLLIVGAHRHHANKQNDTALTLVIQNCGDSTIIQALLGSEGNCDGGFHVSAKETTNSLTSNINHINKDGETPLTLAISKKCNLEVIRLIVEAGANVNYSIGLRGETPLILALKNPSIPIDADVGQTLILEFLYCFLTSEILKLLLRNNASVNVRDPYGQTALMLAGAYRYNECLQALLEAGANVNLKDTEGKTALMLAACLGRTKCVQALLSAKAEVNVTDTDGKTALMLAAEWAHTECLQTLLEAGAEVNVTDKGGKTALMLAAESACIECVQALLDAGADVHVTDTGGRTALMYAVDCRYVFVKLIQAKTKVNFNALYTIGSTAEMCEPAPIECLQALLKAGADVNVTDKGGKTALMSVMSVKSSHLRIESVDTLLNAGADVNITDTEGKTALTIAPGVFTIRLIQKSLAKSAVNLAEGIIALLLADINIGNDHITGPLDTSSDVDKVSSCCAQDNTRKIKLRCKNFSININKKEQKTFILNDKMWLILNNTTKKKPCLPCCLLLYGKLYGYSQITDICKDHKCSHEDLEKFNDVTDHELKALKSAFGDYDKCLSSFVDVTRELSNSIRGETPTVVEFTTCGSEICESLLSCVLSKTTYDSWKSNPTHINEIAIRGHHKICVQLSAHTTGTSDDENTYYSDGLLHAAIHGHDRCIQFYTERGLDVNFSDKHGITPLMCAALRGHDKCVQLLIDRRCVLNHADESESTALMYAAEKGHDKCVKLLIGVESGFGQSDKETRNALRHAAMNGHDKCLHLLIKASCTVDGTQCLEECGFTALMLAAKNGQDKCVQLLIEAGSTVDLTDDSYKTALMFAAEGGHNKCVYLLIQAKSDPNARDTYDNTPLVYATRQSNTTTAQLLIDNGAHVQPLWEQLLKMYARYNLGSSCVRFIFSPPECPEIDDPRSELIQHERMRKILKDNLHLCDFLVVPEASQGHVKCLQVLQKNGMNIIMSKCVDDFRTRILVESDLTTINSLVTVGADVNTAYKNGMTPLMIFANKNFIFGLNKLLEYYEVEINKQSNEGLTALHCAVQENAVKCTDVLLEAGADVNKVTNDGGTCLMIAASKGHDECLSLLLQYARQLDYVSHDRHTALMMAAREGQEICVKLLINNGADNDKTNLSGETALMLAAREGHIMCVHHLLDSGCNINVRSKKDFTAVMMATRMGHSKCLQRLITAQANLDMVDRDRMTSLMHAAREGQRQCLELLIIAGATLDLTDRLKDQTALMFAAETGQVECLLFLLSSNADINFQNKSGKTAVMVAVESQQGSCLYHLLTAGADVTLVDKNKKTAFETAIESDNLELVHIFVFGSADVNFVNRVGLSPLMIALKSNKLKIARYLVALTFMNMHDLMYRPIAVTATEASEFERNLYSQPWPLKKLCFILISTELGKNPDRLNIVEQCFCVEPFRFTFMFMERTSGESTDDWSGLPLSLSLHEYRTILQKTESSIVGKGMSGTEKDKVSEDDSNRESKEENDETDTESEEENDETGRESLEAEYSYKEILQKAQARTVGTEIVEMYKYHRKTQEETDKESGLGDKETDAKAGEIVDDSESILRNISDSSTDDKSMNVDRHTVVPDLVLRDTGREFHMTKKGVAMPKDTSISDCVNNKDLRLTTQNNQTHPTDKTPSADSNTHSTKNIQNSNIHGSINIHTDGNTMHKTENKLIFNWSMLFYHEVVKLADRSTPSSKHVLQSRLGEKGLKLRPVSPNGDCLITATLRQDSTFSSVQELRNAICDHLLSHRHHYIQFVSVNDMNQLESKVELLRQPGHWNSDIGDVVPLVISNLLRRKSVIYSNNKNFPEIIITPDLSDFSDDDLLYVYHDSPGHYDNVMPLDAPMLS